MGLPKEQWHGLREHPLYCVWANMVARCTDTGRPDYQWYGARGITVCEAWRRSPRAFIEWCISRGWTAGLQIDRERNDGNYEPSNVRLVTHKTNCRNRRSSVVVSVCGQSMSFIEAVEQFGCVPYEVARIRYRRLGWDLIRALAEPVELNADKTACPQGHLYDAANTRVDSAGRRYCRACRRERERLRRALNAR